MNTHRYRIVKPIAHAAPFWRLKERFADASGCCLLDSSLTDPRLGRFSFLMPEVAGLLSAKRIRKGEAHLDFRTFADGNAETRHWIGDPFEALRDRMAAYACANPDQIPPAAVGIPFLGGAILCLGYEAGYILEDLPDRGLDRDPLPDMYALFGDTVLAHDHRSGRTWCAVCGEGPQEDAARRQAEDRFLELESDLAQPGPPSAPIPETPSAPPIARGPLEASQYMAAVSRIKHDIREGRVFEVCMSQQLELDLQATADDVYQDLRRINPAPFSAHLKLPEVEVVCSSPERFLRLDHKGLIESRPIKGTRPRGADPATDARMRRDLESAEKDRAENLMIVDLVRNDIGRVAEYGSVTVPELAVIEAYATVWQMVSTIEGRLRADLDGIDLIKACFPGGSMTGAPKIEAMRIIDELEPVKRQIYSGCIGYLDQRGMMDLNIVIRTCVIRGRSCTIGVGGAVVDDSDPASEYQESLDKAKALIEAIGCANARAAATGPERRS